MGIQFFGEFLVDRWVITRKQLLDALALQGYRNAKFGELATQKGYLTEEQAERIHSRQCVEDMRFGDLAVKMGLLTPDQVHNILIHQKNDYLFLGESLLELGYVTEDILERELAIFEEEQSRFLLDEVFVPAEVAGAPIIAACVGMTRKMFLRVVDLLIKVGDGFILQAESDPNVVQESYHLTISVPIASTEPIRYVLSVSSEVAVAIATKILGEDATRESETIVEDAVCEYCNFICGNVAAKMAQHGIEVEVGPPESHPAIIPRPADGGLVVCYPIGLIGGRVDLRFLVPLSTDP